MAATLEYESAKVVFEGGFRFRSRSGILIVAGLGTLMAVGVILIHRTAWPESLFGWAFVALPGLVMMIMLVAMTLDKRSVFAIRTDGIVERERLIPWRDVRRFCAIGSPHSRRVTLFYSSGFDWRRTLNMDNSMSPSDYEALIARLRAELGGSYPNLKLGGYEDVNESPL